jgi:hypothetical protein
MKKSIKYYNVILQCNKFLDENNIETILVPNPRYNQWIKITDFE